MEYIQKAYKFRIYPNKEQKILIVKTIGSCRFVFNHFLSEWNEAFKATKKGLSYSKCSKGLPALKEEYPWLKEPDSTAIQTTLKHLDVSFTNFFKKQNDRPRFKSKKNPIQSYTSKFTNGNIRIEGKRIKLPKLGLVKIKQSRDLEGRIISATIRKAPSNKYYVSLLVEELEPKAFDKTCSHVGIDMGIKDLMIISNGDNIPNIKTYDALQDNLAKAQRSLSRKQKGSSNYYKAKTRVARIHERIANIRLDYLHKVTTELVKNHDFIAVEDLSTKSMLKKIKQSENPIKYNKNQNIRHKNISDASWRKLIELLTYKTTWYGKTLVKVGKSFPSTQLCSSCGYKNSALKDTSIRTWECPECNSVHDRDFNASINILNEGLRKNPQPTVGTTGIACFC